MERTILHVDMNNFFASVECMKRPILWGVPVAVCGDEELRHGIVLAKNYEAKSYGITTGEPICRAREKCPNLVTVPAHMEDYVRISCEAKKLYSTYTDRVESYGIDECWLDVTGSGALFGDGRSIADDIRRRVKRELGLTVSVGVSYNKVFAKLGSDYKKPDAVTVIDKENYRSIVWPLPVTDLLFVGRKTGARLKSLGIETIGQLALANEEYLYKYLGKNGLVLHCYAMGADSSAVMKYDEEYEEKSIGNSTTAPRDIITEDDAKVIFTVLAESVSRRLRKRGKKATVIKISVRYNTLKSYEKQCKCEPTFVTRDLVKIAMMLFLSSRDRKIPVRSLGIQCAGLEEADEWQITLFGKNEDDARNEELEKTIDSVREKYGDNIISRGIVLSDGALSGFTPSQKRLV